MADRITAGFREKFWAGDHCVEYLNAEHGVISHHGLTDVDWAAIATGLATPGQVKVLWPQLRNNPDFVYNGIPTGISTRPETYEDWEMMYLDRHDLAAMGRVWYVEAWARSLMGDREGLLESLRKVARVGRENNWVLARAVLLRAQRRPRQLPHQHLLRVSRELHPDRPPVCAGHLISCPRRPPRPAAPAVRPAAAETGPWREPGQAVDAAYLRDGKLRYGRRAGRSSDATGDRISTTARFTAGSTRTAPCSQVTGRWSG